MLDYWFFGKGFREPGTAVFFPIWMGLITEMELLQDDDSKLTSIFCSAIRSLEKEKMNPLLRMEKEE